MQSKRLLPKASTADTLAALGEVITPVLGSNVALRGPRAVASAEERDPGERASRRLDVLRERYGAGPLLLRLPLRRLALVLSAADVRRVLSETPDPFATFASERARAAAHFEPHGLALPSGGKRVDRRSLAREVLQADSVTHSAADRLIGMVHEEAKALLAETDGRGGQLCLDDFARGWARIVRRAVLGSAARDDARLAEDLARLRRHESAGRRDGSELRSEVLGRLGRYLEAAEPESLAGAMASLPSAAGTNSAAVVTQWLGGFDSAGTAAFRALSLLATHPEQAVRARREAQRPGRASRHDLRYLRACILESLRLWPTSPMLLRQTVRATEWEGGFLPSSAVVAIFTPFFHRDPCLADAQGFSPERWAEGDPSADWPLVPFGDGPARCPGRSLALLLGSVMLAEVLDRRELHLVAAEHLDPARPLPWTLDNHALRLVVGPRRNGQRQRRETAVVTRA